MTQAVNLCELFKNQSNIYQIDIVKSYDFYGDINRTKIVFSIHSDCKNKTIDNIKKILSENHIETYNNREEDKCNFVRLSFTLCNNEYEYTVEKAVQA
jgi:hypothetical protein